MDIGGINQSNSMDFSKNYKMTEKVVVSRPVEINSTSNEDDKNENQIINAVGKINKVLEGEGTHVQYQKHDVLNQMIISVIDDNTNEVIREIPSKKILDMVAKMCEMAGILVNKKA